MLLFNNSLRDDLALPDGIVAYANYASFTPGRVIEFDRVQSRMLVWCLSGSGTIEVNGKVFKITPKSFLFLPWNHSIRYKASIREPFLLAGIHIIPSLKSAEGFDYSVFHTQRQDLAEYRRRNDIHIEGLEGISEGKFATNSRLEQLGSYLVQWFGCKDKPLFMAKFLASAIIYELLNEKSNISASYVGGGTLKDILAYIERHIDQPLDIDTIAQDCNCSRASLFRLFKTRLSTTPRSYITEQKLKFATELLKKSNLRIGQIADRVGIGDQYYFSKLFRQQYKMTATQYRRQNSLV